MSALGLDHAAEFGAAGGREVDAAEAVVEYLRDRNSLMILDNCEHAIDAAAACVEQILLACPGVEVLATSRERLGIPGEILWRVPPLRLAAGNGRSDAVTLFVDRARAVNPSFAPARQDLDYVLQICQRLDGMPLAIELAAARVRSLSVQELALRLDSGIGVLAGGPRTAAQRQRTLRATIDWSYQLLGPAERDLFACISVFLGSFTLPAAEAAASPTLFAEHGALDCLDRLIDSSVVTPTPVASGVRYRMLETLRIYAKEKLTESGNTDAVMSRLLDYFLEALEAAEDDLRGPNQIDRLDRIEADQETLGRVLDWGEVHAPARALRLAGMMGWFWFLKGSGTEARSRMGKLLEAGGPTADARSRGDGQFYLSLHDLRPDRVRSGFEAARAAYAEGGYDLGVANAMVSSAFWGADLAETTALLDESADLYTVAAYDWGVALVRFLQAGIAMHASDIATAIRLGEEATKLFAAIGDSWGQVYSWLTVGAVLRARGDYDEAERAFRSASDHAGPMRFHREMAMLMSELASIALMRHQYDSAEQLLLEAQEYADEIPFSASQGMVRNARGHLARLRGEIDESRRLHTRAIEVYEQGENPAGLAYSHSCLGFTEEIADNLKAARSHHLMALERAQEAKDAFAVALGLEGLGATLIAGGESVRGVEMISTGLAVRERAGTPLPSGERSDVHRALEAAATALDAVALQQAVTAGRDMELEVAVSLATNS